MPRQLKVFRTAAGFHDAYIAAPSRKAALAAWGAARDLFATGAAQQVTDPALMQEPLAHPGEVIRKARGSFAEHLAQAPAAAKPALKPTRPPSRAALDRAEAALAAFEQTAADDLAALQARLQGERERLGRRRQAEHEKYAAALRNRA